jgi:thiosulfate/3-mercaptopyruvate sulfurtransferase
MKTLSTMLFAFGVLSAQQPDGAAINPPWTSAEVIHSDDLARMIKEKPAPAVYQVGFAVMYKGKHIPGSVYAGPGRTEDGLAELKKAVAGVPKDRLIVLYCGCCPWDHCPNMKPAYKLLQSLGYSKIKVTEIPTNFATDWIAKGYPVEGDTASGH